ncbi:MAG: hypothetical protein A2X49_04940 [Lentisphaerae bacterium GWF2_52_8]|nr:MAG: hypothetical protein A2X49_04940 [Lentisphaerae bacterium GWF2_52_8]
MQTYKVLIVDDEAGMRSGAERSIEGYEIQLPEFSDRVNFTVTAAATGAEAAEIIAAAKPDIILLDYKLPDITGLDLLEKAGDGIRDIAVIMITAFASLEVAVTATKRGAFDFLAKPFTPEELRATLQKAARHIYLQRKARKLEEEKRHIRFQFISVLAHELKSPLSAVEGYMHLMNERVKGEALKDYESIVERSLIRLGGMRKLVLDLLDLTRLESGRKKRELAPLDLAKQAVNAADAVAEQAKTAGVKLELRLPPELPLNADSGEMDMILSNLLTNAVKYNKPGGKVTLEIEASQGWVNIICRDTGIGMTKEESGRLFLEFTRIKNAHTRNIPGSGLGLSIVDKVVKLYGGNVTVESEYGKGTTFRVCLKSAVPAQQSAGKQ